MRFLLSLLSLALTLSSSAMADVPAEKRAERDGIASPGGSEGAAGICTIIYYNYCSGWIWLWSPFRAGGERDYYWQIGVVFDLPEDCGKEPDEECTNLQFWWYWRYTIPGYYFTLDYHLWELDDQWCKTGAAIGSILGDDPIERWNSYPGMGSTNADYVAITASSFYCCPYWVTDAPARNANAPGACNGCPGPGPAPRLARRGRAASTRAG